MNSSSFILEDLQIAKITQNQIPEAAHVIALAFEGTPNVKAIWNRATANPIISFEKSVRIAKLEKKLGVVLVAIHKGKLIGACNMIESPHCQPGFFEKFYLAARLLKSYGKYFPRAMKMTSCWAKHDPHSAHWHIGPIGVLPEFKGKGIGTALLNSCLKLADDSRKPAYLETDSKDNVRLYERSGFTIRRQVSLLGNTNWFMWREVHRQSA